jgi:hypothetical protein
VRGASRGELQLLHQVQEQQLPRAPQAFDAHPDIFDAVVSLAEEPGRALFHTSPSRW